MSKIKYSKENKKKDGDFKTKNIKQNPTAQSARAVFGALEEKHLD